MTAALAALLLALGMPAQDKKVWTDAADPTLPADFQVQGEYSGGDVGAQVIALGGGQFQAVLYPGGLPGAGWDGKSKILLAGRTEGGKTAFVPAEGPRKYLAQKPEEFSATRKFPAEGQKPWSGSVELGTLVLKTDAGAELKLSKLTRTSPTMGERPPAGAIVLFDGKNTDEWKGGRLDEKTGWLNTDGRDILSKRKFMNYTAHVEFMLPYRPDARGQGRGNSGFYQVDHYEL